ncbi:MAG UNVERIFIED_CONTAM: hypothetical protein LVR18_46100 [Planctomycetaceae bacterium]|jgi:hypothetical protein
MSCRFLGADKEHSFGDLGAQPSEAAGIFEEFNDFLEVLFGRLESRHVFESGGFFALFKSPGRAADEPAHHAASTKGIGGTPQH